MGSELLPLLGLCRRANMMAVGEEPVEAAARAKDARVLLLASDAADNTVRRVRHFAEMGNCPWLQIPFTKAELGAAMGRTSCAILAVTDIGFAANIVRRLVEADPARYGETADRLDQKAEKAARRKAEARAHEKNLRQGRVKRKAQTAPAQETVPAPEPPAEKTAPVEKRQSGGRRYVPSRSGGNGGGERAGKRTPRGGHPTGKTERSAAPQDRWRHSRPVKKGKGSPKSKRDVKA